MNEHSVEKDALDHISKARLADTLSWARKAWQEASDLGLDAAVNTGLESLEEPAEAVAEALEGLLAAARAIRILPPGVSS
jgi:hypothetical protein